MKRSIKLNVFGDSKKKKIQHVSGISDETSIIFTDAGDGTGFITIKLHVASGLKTLDTGSIVEPNSLCAEIDTNNELKLINSDSFVQLIDTNHTAFLNLQFAFNGKIGSTLGKTEGSTLEDL